MPNPSDAIDKAYEEYLNKKERPEDEPCPICRQELENEGVSGCSCHILAPCCWCSLEGCEHTDAEKFEYVEE